MKKWFTVFGVVLLLIAVPTVGACTTPTPVSEPVILKVAEYSPPGTSRTETLQWWGDEIERRTEGQVKFEFFWSQGLVKSREIPEALRDGLADVGIIFTAFYSDKFPLATVGSLPFLGGKSITGVAESMQGLLTTHPALIAEFDNWNIRLLYVSALSPMRTFSTKPITSLDDFKGMKIRSLGYAEIPYRVLEAATITLPTPELYEALQRRTIEAEATGVYTWWGHGHAEVAKYILQDDAGIPAMAFQVINKDAYERLTPEQQRIVDEVSQEAFFRAAEAVRVEEDEILAQAEELGVTITSLPAGEYEQWVELAAPATYDKWLSDMEEKGLPGDDILELYKEKLREHNALIE